MNRSSFLILFIIFQASLVFSQTNSDTIIEGDQPSYSANGRYMTYIHKGNIWVIDLRTNSKKQITFNKFDCSPRLEPKGDKIVFQSHGDTTWTRKKKIVYSIWIADMDGTNKHKFIEEDKDNGDQYPFWSPDGKKIAWSHGKQLWIADYDGKNAKPLTSEPAIKYECIVDWSKDSRTIMYLRSDGYFSGPNYYISLIDTNGENQRAIVPEIYTRWAKFSKDDNSIYFIFSEDTILTAQEGSLNKYGYLNYLSKYYFSDGKIEDRYFKINEDENELYGFEFSPDFTTVTFDNSGPGIMNPQIYIEKIK